VRSLRPARRRVDAGHLGETHRERDRGASGSSRAAAGHAARLYGLDRLKVTGRSYLGTPATAPTDTDLSNGSISLYLDETNSTLKVRVKFANGTTLKTATIALA